MRRSRSSEVGDIAVDGLVGRISAYSTVAEPPATAAAPAPPVAPASPETVTPVAAAEPAPVAAPEPVPPAAPVREYPHPFSDQVRVVPMLGSLDERTLALLQSVVDPGTDAPRRVVVLQLDAGATVTRAALRELADAHVRAAAAGNWIVLVCADDAVRAELERLDVPAGPRIGATNAEAMRLALDVVAASACAA